MAGHLADKLVAIDNVREKGPMESRGPQLLHDYVAGASLNDRLSVDEQPGIGYLRQACNYRFPILDIVDGAISHDDIIGAREAFIIGRDEFHAWVELPRELTVD